MQLHQNKVKYNTRGLDISARRALYCAKKQCSTRQLGRSMINLTGAKVLVVGLGDTGLSMARWLVRRGAIVRVVDTREAAPHQRIIQDKYPQIALALGRMPKEWVEAADMIAVSPGIDRRGGLIAKAAARGTPVVGDIELFSQWLNQGSSSPQVIAITGSNGKSTVTAMTSSICNAAGRPALMAGNFGLPVLDALMAVEDGVKEPEVYVLELSSFQLESTFSLKPDAATVLNLSEDHLDRYADMDEYAQAKGRIYQNGRYHIFNREDQWSNTLSRSGVSRVSFGLDIPHEAESWGMTGHGKEAYLCRGSTEILALNQMSVTGLHNAANAIASGALCRAIGIEDYAIIKGLIQFKGLPHRVEKIDSFQNVDFYDDSKGTNVGATVAALKGMLQPVILIAGGDGKAQDFNALATAVRECARAIVLIGRDAPQIAELIGGDFSVHFAADMAEAVELAYQLANSGDAVLLSPACASYDMYRSYVHRAEVFVSAVSALKRGQS